MDSGKDIINLYNQIKSELMRNKINIYDSGIVAGSIMHVILNSDMLKDRYNQEYKKFLAKGIKSIRQR